MLRYQCTLVGGKENLSYRLDIWFARKKVLNVEWNDEGALEVICTNREMGARARFSLRKGDK